MTPPSVVTDERFAQGLTFSQWLIDIATPENLAREASMNRPRQDWSAHLRTWYDDTKLSDAQVAALRWLAAQPGGPAKMLVIAEEWSSDCRRDVPVFARMADAAPFDLRIFRRDGKRFSSSARPTLAEAPDSNADLMAEFLNDKNGQTWQSIPVAVFYTKDLRYLYHYTEYPAIYHKDTIVPKIRTGGGDKAFADLQQSPFFRVWGQAAVDEIITALHERLVMAG